MCNRAQRVLNRRKKAFPFASFSGGQADATAIITFRTSKMASRARCKNERARCVPRITGDATSFEPRIFRIRSLVGATRFWVILSSCNSRVR